MGIIVGGINVKKILFILLCVSYLNANAYDGFDRAVKELKDYGFAFCLEESYVDKKEKAFPPTKLSYDLYIFQQGSMKFAIMGGLRNEEQVAKSIRNFVSQYRSNPKNQITNNKQGIQIYIMECMNMFQNSKEYQDEVERIVKKYCKDCE